VVRVEPRLLASQVTALQALAAAGWGLYVGMADDVRQPMAEGRLAPVLPDWRLAPAAVYAVTPRRDEQPAKVRHALLALQQHFAARPA
jgi:DNA-binding transcriptional LysR family regulator